MRVSRILMILAALLLAIGCGALYVIDEKYTDKTPPTIDFAKSTLTVSIQDGDEALLRDVTATDETDGDITHKVRVGSISSFAEDGSITVEYVVFDNSDNRATASRSVRFSDYHSPVFLLSKPFLFTTEATPMVSDRLNAVDILDGSVSQNIRLINSYSIDMMNEGDYFLTAETHNSMGDTVTLTMPFLVVEKLSRYPVVGLTQYLLYLPRGAAFDPADYFAYWAETPAIATQLNEFLGPVVVNPYEVPEETEETEAPAEDEAAQEPDEEEDEQSEALEELLDRLPSNSCSRSMRNVTVTGEVDTSVPGTYYVYYSYTNKNGDTGRAPLTVVVE